MVTGRFLLTFLSKTVDVPAAYALVSADGVHPFFAYGTVIDNQSQDSVYVKGRPLRAP